MILEKKTNKQTNKKKKKTKKVVWNKLEVCWKKKSDKKKTKKVREEICKRIIL